MNPVNGHKLPVFIADYVLTGYGPGAIMAVPATTSATGSSRPPSLDIVEVSRAVTCPSRVHR